MPEKIIINVNPKIKDLIPDYLNNRKRNVTTIRMCLKNSDFKTIETIGHRMRGLGRTYGFAGISDIGTSIEKAALNEDKAAIEEMCKHLLAYLDNIDLQY